ncbi:MAG: hypothetical protein IT480_16500 [Gammaproteobacteria bacterium]|nr:hypothetical protein [Gammaproteobacteria bacterium]
MRSFVFISTGLRGGPGMRRAALCAFAGVLLMGAGGLVATLMVIVALFRMLFAGFVAGGRLLFTALLVGLLAQLGGTLLLRLGSLLMRTAVKGAADAADAPAHTGRRGDERMAGAARRRTGVTIDGEVVQRKDRKDEEPPRLEGGAGR